VRRFIEWLSTEFVDWFGTPVMFAVWTALFAVWLLPLGLEGWARWNATWGLFGNTTESTVELFLEIAILIVARRVDVEAKRSKAQGDAADAKRDELIAAVSRMETEHGTMLTELHDLVHEMHAATCPPSQ